MSNYTILPNLERETLSGTQTSSLITEAYTNRKIFLFGEIDDKTVYTFTAQMLHLMEDETTPIEILINSPGGLVNSGLALYDIITATNCPVHTYCIGQAASMAAIVFSAGNKGKRFMLPHSEIMIHEPLIAGGFGGSASSIKNTADSIIRTRDVLSDILAKHTGKGVKAINKAVEYDHVMSAKEAIEFGIADEIIDHI